MPTPRPETTRKPAARMSLAGDGTKPPANAGCQGGRGSLLITDGPHAAASAHDQPVHGQTNVACEKPDGRRFRYGVPGETPSMWRTVVGIVGDTLPDGPESRIYPQFFLPQTQVPWTASMDMVIRIVDNRLPLASSIRRLKRLFGEFRDSRFEVYDGRVGSSKCWVTAAASRRGCSARFRRLP